MRPEERRRKAQREAYLESLGPRERARAEDFSFYSDVFPFLPTNVKAYIQSQLGLGSLGGPITELDFTEQELAEMDRIMFEDGTIDPNKINYVDYGVDTGKIARPGVFEGYVNQYNDVYGTNITQQDILNNPSQYNINVNLGDGFESMTFEELFRRYGPNILTPTDSNLIKDLNNPAFNLMTFLGKADYETDPEGNIVITDTFDFAKPTEIQQRERDKYVPKGSGKNFVYETLRDFTEKNLLSSDIPVKINLGTEEEYKERVGKNLGGALLKYYGEK